MEKLPMTKATPKVTSTRKTLDDLVPGIRKSHGDRSIAALGEDGLFEIERLRTGVLALDGILSGGLARGKMVEMYGPEGCLAADTHIAYAVVEPGTDRHHNTKGGTIERLYERFNNIELPAGKGQGKYQRPISAGAYFTVPSMNEEGRIFHNRVIDVVCAGVKPCFRMTTESGFAIEATSDHPFYDGKSYVPLAQLRVGDSIVVHNNTRFSSDAVLEHRKTYEWFVKFHPVASTKTVNGCVYHRLPIHRAVYEAWMNNIELDEYRVRLNSGDLNGLKFLDSHINVHHLDENYLNNSIENLVAISHSEHARLHAIERHNNLRFMVVDERVVSIEAVGDRKTYDIKVEGPDHNFIANKFVVHNCGKTSIALRIIAEAQKIGKAVFIDAENAFDPAMAEKSGVDTRSLFVSQPDTAETAFEIIESILPAEDVVCIVVDSVEGLVCRAEVEGDYGDAFVGVKARLMSAGLRKLSRSMVENDSKVVIVWINQIRENINTFGYGPKTTTPGGRALKFWCSTRIEVSRTGQVKQGEDIVGHNVKTKVVKNRFAPPFQVADFDIIYGSGISNEGTILDAAVAGGLIDKAGAWFKDAATGEVIGQGRLAAIERIATDTELADFLTRQLYAL